MTPELIMLTTGAAGVPLLLLLVLGGGELALRRAAPVLQARVRPWLWMAPMLVTTAAILSYPLVRTLVMAFQDADGTSWAGLRNFTWAVSDAVLPVLRNNLLWAVCFPLVTVALALAAAVMLDRVRYERLARTLILLPSALSFVAAGVVWRMLYEYQALGRTQTGAFNAILAALGIDPVPWLVDRHTANFALMLVAVWMSLGVATMILSAGVKGVPGEILESARVDGAGEWRIFWHILLPALRPTVLVVLTTQVIFALKIFDIVYVMTNGSFGTDVVANRMYTELFLSRDFGHAGAIAVILLLVSLPVVALNIRQMRAEARP
ncbi:carbohydrate ABC transporter permease [Streptomyces sp. NPDC058293]|uniref:carbohydrate ABC transporter permease n=1 Tax=Streptomyces sp. NPDC058293 TaxID=3346429 RepID=UPI0036E78427